jgi:hypothetical protein
MLDSKIGDPCRCWTVANNESYRYMHIQKNTKGEMEALGYGVCRCQTAMRIGFLFFFLLCALVYITKQLQAACRSRVISGLA